MRCEILYAEGLSKRNPPFQFTEHKFPQQAEKENGKKKRTLLLQVSNESHVIAKLVETPNCFLLWIRV